VRYALPIVAAIACLVVGTMVPPVIGFVLLIAAFGFVIDVSTKLFENAGKTGGLGDHRQ
jgi:zinc transporter ZupT